MGYDNPNKLADEIYNGLQKSNVVSDGSIISEAKSKLFQKNINSNAVVNLGEGFLRLKITNKQVKIIDPETMNEESIYLENINNKEEFRKAFKSRLEYLKN